MLIEFRIDRRIEWIIAVENETTRRISDEKYQMKSVMLITSMVQTATSSIASHTDLFTEPCTELCIQFLL